jgi:hypothetical protein
VLLRGLCGVSRIKDEDSSLNAEQKMVADLPRTLYSRGMQTTLRCCGQKPWLLNIRERFRYKRDRGKCEGAERK